MLLDRSGGISHPPRTQNRSGARSVIDSNFEAVQYRADGIQKDVDAAPREENCDGATIRIGHDERS